MGLWTAPAVITKRMNALRANAGVRTLTEDTIVGPDQAPKHVNAAMVMAPKKPEARRCTKGPRIMSIPAANHEGPSTVIAVIMMGVYMH